MVMNNVAILNVLYHYIYKNKQGIHVPNTDLPSPITDPLK